MYINDQPITATQFAWDECHKIYLINTPEDKQTYLEYEYKLFDIAELEQAYINSCGLKFISNGDLDLPDVVPQGQEAIFN